MPNAFDGELYLRNITLNANLKEIGYAAFNNCPNLVNVYYELSDVEWENVDVKEKNDAITNIIYLHRHTYDTEWSYDENYHWHYSNCEHEGLKDLLLRHTYDEGVVTKEATLEESGLMEFSCECGHKITEVIAKLEFFDYELLSSGGYKILGFSNTTKGSDETKNFEIPSIYNKKFITTIDKEAFIDDELIEAVIIPSSITRINKDAFKGAVNLKYVYYNGTIDDWLNIYFENEYSNPAYYATIKFKSYSAQKLLAESVDDGYNILTKLNIPQNITSINDYAFYNFKQITELNISNNVVSVGKYAFSGVNISYLEIPSSINHLLEGTFKDAKELTELKLNENLKTIYDDVFSGCDKLEKIYFYSSNIKDFEKIDVKDGNDLFNNARIYLYSDEKSIEDNTKWYYDQDNKISIWNVSSKGLLFEEIIIDGKTYYEVSKGTFDGEFLTIPSIHNDIEILRIKEEGFKGINVKSIELLAKLDKIGQNAFDSEIENVYFIGTLDEWNNIDFETGNDAITNAKFYYYSNTVVDLYDTSWHYVLTDQIEVWEPHTDGLIFEPIYNDAKEIVGYGVRAYQTRKDILIIPSTYAFKPVIKILENGFKNQKNFGSLVLPKSIKEVGESAFSSTSLGIIYYGGTEEEFNELLLSVGDENNFDSSFIKKYYYTEESPTGYDKYWHLINNNQIEIWEAASEGLIYKEYYRLGEFVGYSVSMDDRIVNEIIIPAKYNNYPVIKINAEGFAGRTNLYRISIGKNIEEIEDNAFLGCYRLVEIYNYSNLQLNLDSDNFGGVSKYAKYIQADRLNKSVIYTNDDYVYVKINDNVYLIDYLGNDINILIPNTIDGYDFELNSYAYYQKEFITSLEIRENIHTIPNNAFEGLSNLKVVILPKLTLIDNDAFKGVGVLDYVYTKYETMDEFNNVDYTAGNDALFNSKTYYLHKDSDVIDEETYWHYVDDIATVWHISSTNLEYDEIKDQNENIIAYSVGNGTSEDIEIIIPRNYRHLPVIEFKEEAFINKNIKTVTIYGNNIIKISDSAFKDDNQLESITDIPTLRYIGDNAFDGCINLLEFNIPDEVNYLGSYAFKNARKLTEIRIPSLIDEIKDGTFKGCLGISEINIPDNIKTIGDEAFMENSIQRLNLPNNLTSIGKKAFKDNQTLIEVTIPTSIDTIDEETFSGANFNVIVIPNNIKLVESNAFANNDSLNWVAITSIGTVFNDNAFTDSNNIDKIFYQGTEDSFSLYRLTVLTQKSGNNILYENHVYYYKTEEEYYSEVVDDDKYWHFGDENEILIWIASSNAITYGEILNENEEVVAYYVKSYDKDSLDDVIYLPTTYNAKPVTYIGDEAFKGATNIKEIYVSSSISRIGDSAFEDCNNLIKISLHNNITEIGIKAFKNASKLTNINLPKNLTTITEEMFMNCNALVNLSIPNTVTLIDKNAFNGASKLQKIQLSNLIERIEEYAFSGCSQLSTFSIVNTKTNPSKLNYLGKYAFNNCNSLKELLLANDIESNDILTEIKEYTFNNCTSLIKVSIPSTVIKIGDYAFNNNENLKSLTLPHLIENIGEYFIDGCNSITYNIYNGGAYLGSPINKYMLFVKLNNTNMVKLIMNQNTRFIYNEALKDATSLEFVSIPNNIDRIRSKTFSGCTNLRQIVVPLRMPILNSNNEIINENKFIIEEDSFKDCQKLNVYYLGSSKEIWNERVDINNQGNDAISDALNYYYYSASEPLDEEMWWKYTLGEIDVWKVGSFGLIYNPIYENNEIIGYSINKDPNEFDTDMLVIPARYKDKPILKIEENAFISQTQLVSVKILGDNLIEIGASAFELCYRLVEVMHNLSHLQNEIKLGEENNGYIAYYARKIHGVEESSIIRNGDFVFAYVNAAGYSDELEFTLINDNTAYEVGIGSALDQSIIIPSTYNGLPVKKIKENGFKNATYLQRIEIPSTVEEIGASAFSGCINLSEVYYLGDEETWPTLLTSEEDKLLSDVTMYFTNMSGSYISDAAGYTTNLVYTPFEGEDGLTYYEVSVGNNTDEAIIIPEVHNNIKVLRIKENGFKNATNLVRIQIPSTLQLVGSNAFVGCVNLKYIYYFGSRNDWNALTKTFANRALDSANIYYGSNMPSSYNKHENYLYLVKYVGNKNDVVLPNNLIYNKQTIDSYRINQYAFLNNETLETIMIPTSVNYVGLNAFMGCTNLKKLYHSATTYDAWNSVSIKNGNEKLANAQRYYYSQNKPLDEETCWHYDSFGNVSIWQVASVGLEYTEIIKNNEVVGYEVSAGECALDDIVIPARYMNLPVSSIKEEGFKSSLVVNITILGNNLKIIEKAAFLDAIRLESINGTSSIITIRDNAFKGAYNLKYATDFISVTTIGESAFEGCSSLETNLNLNSVVEIKNNAFKDCVYLTTLSGMGLVERIGDSAFEGDTRLSDISGMYNLISVGDKAFKNCTSLVNVLLPASLASLGSEAFKGDSSLEFVSIISIIEEIKDSTFEDCTSLKNIIFEAENVRFRRLLTIGKNAFKNCILLNSIDLPNSVLEIKDYAYYGDYNITSVNLSPNLTTIGESAFEGMNNFKDIVIKEKVAEIKKNAFKDTSLERIFYEGNKDDIVIEEGNEPLDEAKVYIYMDDNPYEKDPSSSADKYWHYINETEIEIWSLSTSGLEYELSIDGTYFGVKGRGTYEGDEIIIASSYKNRIQINENEYRSVDLPVKVILDNAFENDTNIRKIVMPNTITSIAERSFYGCQNLEEIEFSNNITSIGKYAFSYCTNLTSIILPEKLDIINESAFNDCNNLTEVKFNKALTSIRASAFYGCKYLVNIILPENLSVIAQSAFANCELMQNVYFEGAEDKFEQNWKSDFYEGVKFYYYSDTKPTENNKFWHYVNDLPEVWLVSSDKVIFDSVNKNEVIGLAEDYDNDIVIALTNNGVNVTKINSTFKNFNNLTSIVIPNTIKVIEEGALTGCAESLKLYYLGNEASWQYVEGSSAINNNSNILVFFYSDEIPTSEETYWHYKGGATGNEAEIWHIASPNLEYYKENDGYYVSYKFESEIDDIDIIIPDVYRGVKVVGIKNEGFKDTNITSINLPKYLTKVGSDAFSGCSNLTKVYFDGENLAAWDERFGSNISSGNDNLLNAVRYYYSVTNKTAEDSYWHYNDIGEIVIWTVASTGLEYIPIIDELTGEITSYAVSKGTAESIDIIIPEYYRNLEVTTILENGFKDFRTLVVIRILGDKLKYIENNAFDGCSALVEIKIPENVISIGDYAFRNCVILMTINLPNTLTSIGKEAFYKNNNINGIVFNSGNLTIGEDAFKDCGNLTSIYFNSTIDDYLKIEFENEYSNPISNGGYLYVYRILDDLNSRYKLEDLTIPTSTTNIKKYQFYNFKLKSVILNDNLATISENAFKNCDDIEIIYANTTQKWASIQFEDGNEAVASAIRYYYSYDEPTGEETYWHYNNQNVPVKWVVASPNLSYVLNSNQNEYEVSFGNTLDRDIKIPSEYKGIPVTKISASGFKNKDILSVQFLASSIEEIGEEAFALNHNLTQIDGTSSVRIIGSYAFNECEKLTTISIPSVTEINDGAFFGAKLLDNVILPDTLEALGDFAFAECSSLPSISIPESVINYGNSIFSDCINLSSVVLPNNLITITDYMFNGCIKLTQIDIPDNVLNISTYAFNDCTNLVNINLSKNSNLIRILGSAFANCNKLVEIVLPRGLSQLAYNAFANCNKLENIFFNNNEAAWLSIMGDNTFAASVYFYSEDIPSTNDKYWHYVDNDEIEIWEVSTVGLVYENILDGTQVVSYKVHEGTNLKDIQVVIPKYHNNKLVTSIADYAFKGSNVRSIIIPDSITGIGLDAFANCDNLKTIYYHGSKTDNIVNKLNISGVKLYYYSENVPDNNDEYWHYVNDVPEVWNISYLTYTAYGSEYSVALNNNNNIDVVIPSKYNGKDVTAITNFKNANLRSLFIPSTVITIEQGAFDGANITTVYYDASTSAFAFPETVNVYYYSAEDNVSGNYWHYVNGKTEVWIYATEDLIYTLIDEDNVYKVKGNINNKDITEVTIPATYNNLPVTIIEDGAFKDFINLKTVTILGNNLITIQDNAFSGCRDLTTINIPRSVKTLGTRSLLNNISLKAIILPNSIETISSYAFNGCTNLETIYYLGNSSDWNNIQIGANNRALSDAKIYYYNDVLSIENDTYWHFVDGQAHIWKVTNSDLSFELLNDNYIVKSYDGNDVLVIIPDRYRRLPVTLIGAFNNLGVRGIIIGKNITEIEENAFTSCTNLTSIYYKGSEAEWNNIIKNNAFNNNVNVYFLSETRPNENNKYWHYNENDEIELWQISATGLEFNLVGDYYELSLATNVDDELIIVPKYYLGKEVKKIGDDAFKNLSTVYSIVLPDTINEISSTAFDGALNLEKIYFEGSIDAWNNNSFNINNNIFVYCYNADALDSEATYWHYESDVSQEIIELSVVPFDLNYIYDENTKKYTIGQTSYQASRLVIPAYYRGIPVVGIEDEAFIESTYQITSLVILGNELKRIGASSFARNSFLRNITLPNSLEAIGDGAFAQCNNINNIYFRGTNLASWNELLNLAGSNNDILNTAKLYYYYEYTDAEDNLPIDEDSLWYLDSNNNPTIWQVGTFGLSYVAILDSNDEITSYGVEFGNANSYEIIIPATYRHIVVDRIIDNSFEGLDVTSVKILGNNMRNIGDSAFNNCELLEEVSGISNLEYIGEYAFNGARLLANIILSDTITDIGVYAFNGCLSLTSVNISPLVTEIHEYTFAGDSNITTVTGMENVVTINNAAFNGCRSLTNITLPDTLIAISSQAFNNCSSLVNVIIPNTVTTIGAYSFNGCNNLTSLTLSEDIIIIRTAAFNGCENLRDIVIPRGLKTIGAYTFEGCHNISNIYYLGSEEEWNLVEIGAGNSFSEEIMVYFYTENPPALGNKFWHYVNNEIEIWQPSTNGITYRLNQNEEYYIVEKYEGTNNLVIIAENYLGKPVKEIEAISVTSNDTIENLVIPSSITTIDENAFTSCINLTSIYYKGTKDDGIVSSFGNKKIYYYSDIRPDESDLYWYYENDLPKIWNVSTLGLIYTEIDNDKYGVSIGSVTDDNIIIPARYLGKNVTSIIDFKNINIDSIIIPNTITNIKIDAFTDSTIDEIYFEGNKELFDSIGYVFNNNTNIYYLTDLNTDSYKTYWHYVDNQPEIFGTELYSLYQYTEIINNNEIVGYEIAKGSSNLIEVILPRIYRGLPVTKVSDNGFVSSNRTELVVIPDTYITIGAYAFSNLTNLKKVRLSEGLTFISSYAFMNTTRLEEITLPTSLDNSNKAIDAYAFGDTNLERIYYLGSLESFNNIIVDNIENDSINSDIVYIYKADEPTLSNTYWHYVDGVETIWKTVSEELVYTLISNNEYEVSGNDNTVEEIIIPATYNGRVVSKISNDAFKDYQNLKSVTILGNNLQEIGDYAFSGCISLEEISGIHNVTTIGAYAFENCESIEELILPNSVSEIGAYALSGLLGISNIIIPDSITNISEGLLSNSLNLVEIIIPSSIKTVGDDAFLNTSIESIYYQGSEAEFEEINNYFADLGAYVYYYSLVRPITEATEWHYQNGIPTIWEIASSGLRFTLIANNEYAVAMGDATDVNVVIPSEYHGKPVTTIAANGFSGASILRFVILGDNLTTIGRGAFMDSTLKEAIIPNTVLKIGEEAFRNCVSLADVTLSINLTEISVSMFRGDISLVNIEIPSGIKSIGEYAFMNATSLQNIILPAELEEIGGNAFTGCLNISSILLPKNLINLGDYIFAGRTEEKAIKIYYDSIMDDWNERFTNVRFSQFNYLYYYSSESPIADNTFWHYVNDEIEIWQVSSSELIYGEILDNDTDKNIIAYDVSLSGELSELTDIIIPAIHNGLPVTTIKASGFNDANLRKITVLGNNLITVGENAFIGATSFTGFEGEFKLVTIKENAFKECNQLQGIDLSMVIDLGESAFEGCTSLKNINLNNDLKLISKKAFKNTGITKIIITGNLDGEKGKIDEEAFMNCHYLEFVMLPRIINSISSSAFTNCENLLNIYYLGSIDNWASVNHNDAFIDSNVNNRYLYYYSINKPEFDDTCWHYDSNGNIEIWKVGSLNLRFELNNTNDGYIVSADDGYNDDALIIPARKRDIPVVEIKASGFNSYNIRSVLIPKTVEKIGENAFNNSLVSIYYAGNELNSFAEITGANAYENKNIYYYSDVDANYQDTYWYYSNEVPTLYNSGSRLTYTLNNLTDKYIASFTATVVKDNEDIIISDDSFEEIIIAAGYRGKAIEEIGDFSSNKTKLTKVSILPNINGETNIKVVNKNAFKGCDLLTTITGLDNVIKVDGEVLQDGNEFVYNGAFSNCISLIDISLPNIVIIGDGAFSGCSNLTSITLPESLTTIGKHAFSNCSSLESITIPALTTIIDDYSFSGATSLANVNLHNGVTTISKHAFEGDTSITSIELPEELQIIDDYAFSGVNSVYVFNIPNSVTTIGNYAFKDATTVTTYNLPTNLSSLGEGAFSGARSLRNINIPTGITEIKAYTFSGARSLTNITLPENVKSIDEYAFKDCTELTTLSIERFINKDDELFVISTGAFTNCGKLTTVYLSDTTKDDWDSIEGLANAGSIANSFVYYYSENELPYEATIWHYTDTNKTVKGVYSVATSGLLYELSENNSYTVSRGDATSDEIIIPERYRNLPVTRIKSEGFKARNNIMTVKILGNELTEIGQDAFASCYRLVELYYAGNMELNDNNDGGLTKYMLKHHTNFEEDSILFKDETITQDSQTYSYWFAKVDNNYYLIKPESSNKNVYVLNTLKDANNNIIPYKINDYAFNSTAPYSIQIADNITEIGNYAFYNCNSIKVINTGTNGSILERIGDYAFAGCDGIETFVIPKTVKYVGNNAFDGCSLAKSITFAENSVIASIGEYAFANCSSLTNFAIPQAYNATSSESVTIINKNTFENDIKLTSISLPNTLVTIDDYAFNECISLESLTLGSNVKHINEYAFYNCSSMTQLSFASAPLETIGDYAFSGCESIKDLIIPYTVVSIGNYAFSGCKDVETLVFDTNNNVNNINSIGAHAFENNSSLTSLTLTRGITEINDYSFNGTTSLNTIVISDQVTRIGKYAFAGSIITELNIPSLTTLIDENAFDGCDKLENITLPRSITDIKKDAFKNLSSEKLTTLNYYGSLNEWVSINFENEYSNPMYYDVIFNEYKNNIFEERDSSNYIIEDDITEIKAYSLYNFNNVSIMIISDNINKIGNSAFNGTSNLEKIYYKGTSMEQWNAINKTSGNGNLSDVVIYYYRDSEPKYENTCWYYGENDEIAIWYVASSGLVYTLLADNTYSVSRGEFNTTIDNTELIIPSRYRDLPVSTIEAEAFKQMTNLTKVTIYADPVTDKNLLTTIGDDAFNGCTRLDEITVSTNLESIGARAFKDCNISSFALPGGLKYIDNYAFSGCSNLTEISIPSTIIELGEYVFDGCRGLTSVEIKNGLTKITTGQFKDCDHLVSVTIPTSVKAIDEIAFDGCSASLVVTYLGTQDNWNQIQFGNKALPTTVTINYYQN